MKSLAKVILRSAEIREASWNEDKYDKSIWDATIEAIDKLKLSHEKYGIPSYLLLLYCWNDILEWAQKNV
jgi:hypothetical protein